MSHADYIAIAANLNTDLIRENNLRYLLKQAVEEYARLRARGEHEAAAAVKAEGYRVWIALKALGL